MFKNIKLTSTQNILLLFLITIFIGSFLLFMPFATKNNIKISYIDALFTSTTSVCVTGLVTLPIFSTFNLFGQIVILILIQVGGLGVITIISIIMIKLHRKIGITNRLLIQDAFNLNTMSGLIRFINNILKGTLLVETIGAISYMFVFVPEFGLKGIWISIFNSVSAFCNAGIDIISDNSLCNYITNPIVNFTTCFLIILGGIGFVVWLDFINSLKKFKNMKFKCFSLLNLHSKIAIYISFFLIAFGTFLFFMFEKDNQLTIKNYNFFEQIMICFFQSVTTRTAGFATINQSHLTNSSCIVSLLLMFIGGSPCGTAGGIKTVTFAVLFASTFATIKNKNDTTLFQRTIPKHTINKSVAVAIISLTILFISTILLSIFTKEDMLDLVYETTSATATVGLTRTLTSKLNLIGKTIIIATMYLGRIGPISLFLAFNSNKQKSNIIKNPIEEVSIG